MAKKRRQGSSPRRTPTTDYTDVVKKIRSLEELTGPLKTAFYGKSGTGKTTLSSTFPPPILVLDIKEEGTDSISDIPPELGKGLPINHWDEIEQIYWYLKEGDHPFKTVILDTVTQAQELCLRKTFEEGGKDWGGHITKKDWGASTSKMRTWIINYRDLDMNVVFNAQDRITSADEEDEDQFDPEVGPAVSPSVAKTLNAAVKVLGNTYIREVVKRTKKGAQREVEYCLRVGPHAYYTTKIRRPKNKGMTPEFIVDPSYEKIKEVMRGEYGTEETKKKKTKKKGKVK